MWIRGGKEAESVSSNNESFGDLSKAKYHVNNMTQGECGVFAEVFRIFQNRGSPVLQEESNPNIANDSYDSRVYESQPDSLRLVKVRWEGSKRFIWNELPSWTMIVRQSELRVGHFESKAMWEEAIVWSVTVKEDAGRKIEVEEKVVEDCVGFCLLLASTRLYVV